MSNSSHQDVSILAASSARKKEENKARNWAFQSCWSFPNTTIHEETFDGRKEQAFDEIKRRIVIFMERAGVLPKIQYMSIVIDYTCLGAISATYNISLRCYVQCRKQISKMALQTTFQREADWQPVFGGLSSNEEFLADQAIQPPWEIHIIHGELNVSNSQKKHVSNRFNLRKQ